MDTARTEQVKRRSYIAALAVVTPVLPVIGWLQRDQEPDALVVYAVITGAVVTTLVGLITRRMSVATAERAVVVVISGVLFARLARLLFLADVPLPEVRRFVTETTGPTLIAVVLVLYLAMDTRRGLRWAAVLWAAFSLMLVPTTVDAFRSDPSTAVALIRQVLIVGAVAALASGLSVLKAQLAEEGARARALAELANTDPLTGVHNRRGATEVLREQLARFGRYGGELTVALIDLDRFKDRNDHHGHAAGDAALVAVVAALRADLRVTDALGRWGGDELVIVAPATTAVEAGRSAERWRASVAALDLTAGDGRVTCSIGIASAVTGDTADTLLQRADLALYLAKGEGGDRVVVDANASGRQTAAEDPSPAR